jgi:hypothetical protein
MYRRSDLAPWAERRLTPAEQARVRRSPLTSLVGQSPAGPWVARGPGGVILDRDIREAINRAAGEVVV